jgi:hypothetical protein
MRPILFILRVAEQAGPPPATPQYRLWPLPMGERPVAAKMSATQQCTVTVTFQDAHGNPARVDGVPSWFTDNSDVLSLQPTLDGMSCTASARGPIGTARLTLNADADVGAGVEPLLGTLDFNITGGKATVVQLDAGTPEEQAGKRKPGKG